MNYVKGKIAENLHVPEIVETVRVTGTRQLTQFEKRFPYLNQTLPTTRTTDKQRIKQMKKIKRLANWLDNAVPHSPIPLGVDSILVSKNNNTIIIDLLTKSSRVSFHLLVDQWVVYYHFIKSIYLLHSVSLFGYSL